MRSVAPERIFKWGWVAHVHFGIVSLRFFGSQLQLVVLASAFVMISTVSCLLFFYSRCHTRAQPFVKVTGVRVPRALWIRRHCMRLFVAVTVHVHVSSVTFLNAQRVCC